MNPRIKDYDGWTAAIMEHRRALLERVLQEYPTVKTQFRSQVDIWRLRLKIPNTP
jgi:hypothetical protein